MASGMVVHRSYVEGWRDRLEAESRALDRAAEEKRQRAEKLAWLLAERYAARRVHLFGSLARGDELHPASDIDLAVEGLPPDRYFEALAELWSRLPPGVDLDLVPLEFASQDMLEAVRADGILLYGGK